MIEAEIAAPDAKRDEARAAFLADASDFTSDPASYTQAAKDSVLSLVKNSDILGGDSLMTAAACAAAGKQVCNPTSAHSFQVG